MKSVLLAASLCLLPVMSLSQSRNEPPGINGYLEEANRIMAPGMHPGKLHDSTYIYQDNLDFSTLKNLEGIEAAKHYTDLEFVKKAYDLSGFAALPAHLAERGIEELGTVVGIAIAEVISESLAQDPKVAPAADPVPEEPVLSSRTLTSEVLTNTVTTPLEGPQPVSAPEPAPLIAGGEVWNFTPLAGLPGGLRGAFLCQSDQYVGQHCFIVGCRESGPLGIFMVAESLTKSGLRTAALEVDGRTLGGLTFDHAEGTSSVYEAKLSSGTSDSYLGAMKAGSKFRFKFQDGSDAWTYQGVLRGSSAAISEVPRTCAAPAANDSAPRGQEDVVGQVLGKACQGRGGAIDPKGIYRADLDMNGAEDLVVDEAFISCKGSQSWEQRPLSCGAQVCEFHVFMNQNGAFSHALTGQNTVIEIIDGAPPGLHLYSHGGQKGVIKWTGSGFSRG